LAGASYFLIICIISAFLEPEFSMLSLSCITTFLICAGSGMIGGIIG
jgi:putative membrane protein (TIGR04086 family)